MTRTVLIVEDERSVRDALVRAVGSLGVRTVTATSEADALALLERERVDCALVDVRLREGDGLSLLRRIQAREGDPIPVVMATAYGDSERTIQAMRDGAFDYLTKPFDLDLLLATLERALRRDVAGASPPSADAPPSGGALIGSSAAMLGVWKLIGRAAASDFPVLITGETGTGKELVARAVHSYSARSKEPFVAVNLAALPPTLIESELFGHEKGSFTGASARRSGRIQAAGHGVLFLDEIGDLDLSLQTKLLRVLQDGIYEPVGGTEPSTNRARIVTATNKPVRPGSPRAVLREDLYYRVAVIEIEVPPLRERRSDIPLLVSHVLRTTTARAVSERAMDALLSHDWPGNVRELVHVLQRAAVMCPGREIIDIDDLPDALARPAARGGASPVPLDTASCTLRDAIAALEKQMIRDALARSKGNRAEAARRLGVARPQLYAKMKEHRIEVRGQEGDPREDEGSSG